jgi:DNA repair protein RecN (Recombination protein N)
MLVHLEIRDLAIIDHVTMDFEPEMNVITGETGAGKSILLDALHLLLGGRSDRGLVRKGAERAEVQALFRIDATCETAQRLASRELLDGGPTSQVDVVVRRIITAAGRGRATVNGALVTNRELQDLTRGLVDITGQHDQAQLLRPERHLALLDAYGGLHEETASMARLYGDLQAARAARDDLMARQAEQAAREDYLRFQLEAFEELDLGPGEAEELRIEQGRLTHLESLRAGSRQAEENLSRRPDHVLQLLAASIRGLEALAEHDPELGVAASRMEAARIELDDVALDLARYGERLSVDPFRANHVDERLSAIHQLARRHRSDPDSLGDRHHALAEELSTFEGLDDRLAAAERTCDEAEALAQTHARALSQRRHEASGDLARYVGEELHCLGMEDATVQLRLTARESLGVDGLDRGELWVESNAGEGMHPVRRIASGGELSRLMLALQGALSETATVHTAIYDEVDTGVSGGVAEAIGHKLRCAAASGQAIVITHMPQIAALAGHHLTVTKSRKGSRTQTSVQPVSGAARSSEIARMLGGQRRSKRVQDHADELLRRAKRAA